MRFISLFLAGISILLLYLIGCGNETAASTDLRVEIGHSSQDGESSGSLKVAQGLSEKRFKKERWENISEPNLPEWGVVKKLIKEQKYEAAYGELEKLLQRFRKEGDYERITHTLMKMVQLRIALHGYETAVNFLKKEEWPEGLYSQMVLNLYYAYSLVNYYKEYSWEINQREKIETSGEIDLKKMTKDDIYLEAQRAYLIVFSNRDELSNIRIKSFSNYITPNTYPERIRGTLRDAISYLYVDLLSDTTLWRPEELNEVYMLPLSDMLETGKVSVDLGDRYTHSLMKIVYILDDLSKWHRTRGEEEAAFEAFLEKIRILQARFTTEEDREILKAKLKDALKKVEGYEWWTMGMATLADLVASENSPDALIEAHQIALECQKRFASSIGARMCLSKQREIEAPFINIAGMSVDGVDRRSLMLSYKNLRKAYFRAYKLDFFSILDKAKDYSIFPQYKQLDSIVYGKRADYEWSVDLDETSDFKVHRRFITPPIRDKGLFLIVVSARKDFVRSDNVILGVYVFVSDMILETRNDYDGTIKIRVIYGRNGSPVQKAEVCLYRYDWQKGHTKDQCLLSDINGMARFSKTDMGGSYFTVAKKGDDFTTDLQGNYFNNSAIPYHAESSLIFTDRSVYRPMQKVRWKIVHYYGDFNKGDFKTIPNKNLEVVLYDYNNEPVEKKRVTTNEFGTASGEFVIPKGRLLGNWSIGTGYGAQFIKVEEYKRPTFEVEIKKPSSPLRLNKEAEITGEARYYFGLPVKGKARYAITRQPVMPYWWVFYSGSWDYIVNRSPQMIASGSLSLEKDGVFRIRFVPLADERLSKLSRHMSYLYRINVDVTDEGGETRSVSEIIKVGFSSVEATITSELKFFIAGDGESNLKIIRSGLNGEPRAGRGRFRIVRLKEPEMAVMPADIPIEVPDFLKDERFHKYRHRDDNISPRWESVYNIEKILFGLKDDVQIMEGETSHRENGEYLLNLSSLKAGLYKIYYETIDDFGEKYETSKAFIVTDGKKRFNLPLIFYSQKGSYRVGEKARFLVNSGLDGQDIYLYRYQSGRTEREEILNSSSAPLLYEFEVEEGMRGGFVVNALVYNDYQRIMMGESVLVPWDNKELKLEFITFRDTLRPGSKETFKVKVISSQMEKDLHKTCELLSYMYDRSLDYFTPHIFPSVMDLYPVRGFSGGIRSNLLLSRSYRVSSNGFSPVPAAPSLSPDYIKYLSGYGIGGVGHRRRGGVLRTIGAEYEEGRRVPMMAVPKKLPASAPEEGLAVDMGLGSKTGEARTETALLEDNKGSAKSESERPLELRKEFSETAFFLPHLILEADNTASIEFNVPDSVTSYNLFVHAITKDLRGGVISKEVKVIKELMVRPYVPRFLREGDEAEVKVVLNNSSKEELSGELRFEIVDPQTEKSLISDFGISQKDTTKGFVIKPGGSQSFSFRLIVPSRIDVVNLRVSARSRDFTDGELRPIPILPGRMHLVQSKSVVLKDSSKKTIFFEDLDKNDDPTLINDQMVVTIDAQLFYTILYALPFIVNYPYESTEQILNRFLSSGIVNSVYRENPSIAKMAETFSKERDTRFERWDTFDPNRKLLLEETPYLLMAKGGLETKDELVNILDPEIAKVEREDSLNRLRMSQTSSGGFPWFAGGPPSPYVTLYVLYGFSKALEFKIDVPVDMVRRAWNYMYEHFITELWPYAKEHNCCWEMITFLNYVLSNYPDSSYYNGIFTQQIREEMLDFSFRHWKEHSPYLKGYLALTLNRMKRHTDALLVFESVMDSARYSEDEGTHWAPEDRGWLWYNDSIETHAFAIRVLLELMPEEKKLDGLVQWILMNKRLNHWKSTKATAEVIYSLVKYMKANKTLGIREEVSVDVGGNRYRLLFEPERYTGRKNQILIPKEKIDPRTTSRITIEKGSRGFIFASATWHFSTERLPTSERGDLFTISRSYFKREPSDKGYILRPIEEGTRIKVGDQIEVHISIKSKHPAEYVHLKDPRPAGCEPESTLSRHRWDMGIYWYEEVRDSAQNFFFEKLPQGEYTLKYRLRANMSGRFKVAPATIQSIYAPDFNAYSKGAVLLIEE